MNIDGFQSKDNVDIPNLEAGNGEAERIQRAVLRIGI